MIIRVIFILTILGYHTFSNKLFAQNKDTINQKVFSEPFETEAGFPGGQEKFKEFVRSNLRQVDGAAGKRVIISFVVEKDGTLTNFEIFRGINEEADKEALRVLKLSSKWKPDIVNGQPRRIAYALPIIFPDK